MDEYGGPAAVGGLIAAAFGAIALLAKFKGWLNFETDQSKFRTDLMDQIGAERAQSEKIAQQLTEANLRLAELAAEQMRMRVMVDAIRSQMRHLLGILVDVKEGRLAPEHIRVPEMPSTLLGGDD